jgi:hypothetical protein
MTRPWFLAAAATMFSTAAHADVTAREIPNPCEVLTSQACLKYIRDRQRYARTHPIRPPCPGYEKPDGKSCYPPAVPPWVMRLDELQALCRGELDDWVPAAGVPTAPVCRAVRARDEVWRYKEGIRRGTIVPLPEPRPPINDWRWELKKREQSSDASP